MPLEKPINSRIALEIDGKLYKEWPFNYDTYFKGEAEYLERKFKIMHFVAERMLENMAMLRGRPYEFILIK